MPLNLTIAPVAAGEAVGVTLNGQPVSRAEVADVARIGDWISVCGSRYHGDAR